MMRCVRLGVPIVIDGVSLTRFPVVISDVDGVFSPAVQHLRELGVNMSMAPGSLYDIAGILCAWINWLDGRGRRWDAPTVGLFVEWSKGDEVRDRIASLRQRRRAQVIYAFYEHMDRCDPANFEVEKFVLALTAPIDPNQLAKRRPIRRVLRLKFGRSRPRRAGLRPTPNNEDVEAILEALLGDGSSFLAIRNWLLARTASQTGLRREGLAGLSIQILDRSLQTVGVLDRAGSVVDQRSEGRADIRRRLISLEARGAQNIVFEGVREKSKIRSVSVPIELLRQLLDFIWVDRARHIQGGKAGASRAKSAGAIWISAKTGRALSASAISDIIARGFKAAAVAGSPHRLRAAYAVALFRRLIREAFENGAMSHHAETLLERVAQHLGHERPETLRPYLHTAQLEDLIVNTTARAQGRHRWPSAADGPR